MNTLTQAKLTKITLLALLALSFALILTGAVDAQSLADQAQQGVNAAGGQQNPVSFGDTVIKVINSMLFAVGILSVIMIIVGGIRFVVSAGDSNGVQAARNTILYSVVGLVVAFVAWGIVNFVTKIFTDPPPQQQAKVLMLNDLI
jgi:heme A synthase